MADRQQRTLAAARFDCYRKVRLGRVSKREAESLKHRVEQLLECRILNRPIPADLAAWVAGLPPAMAERLAKVGLLDEVPNVGLG